MKSEYQDLGASEDAREYLNGLLSAGQAVMSVQCEDGLRSLVSDHSSGMPIRIGGSPYVQNILITPDLALAMLESNIYNRPVSDEYVMQIKNDIMADRWIFTGNLIKFFEDGHLADGQHRLLAIAGSGKSVYSLVSFGVKREAAVYIDRGRTRSAAESIHILERGKKFSKEK